MILYVSLKKRIHLIDTPLEGEEPVAMLNDAAYHDYGISGVLDNDPVFDGRVTIPWGLINFTEEQVESDA